MICIGREDSGNNDESPAAEEGLLCAVADHEFPGQLETPLSHNPSVDSEWQRDALAESHSTVSDFPSELSEDPDGRRGRQLHQHAVAFT